MGTCTSTVRHCQKQQQHNRATSKNTIVLGLKSPPPLPPLPTISFPNQQRQHSHYLSKDFDIVSSSLTKPIFHQADTNSLIHLYSCNTNINNNNNNNNNNYSNSNSCSIIDWMSSSASTVRQAPPRIPVPKTRLPVHYLPSSQQANVIVQSRNVASTVTSTNETGSKKPMSITNRPPPPTAMQTRFGFIPRPAVPGLQPNRSTTFAARSRSISPTSNFSGNSSSSSSIASQRLAKVQTTSKAIPAANLTTPTSSTITTNNTSKSTKTRSPRHADSSTSKSNVKSTIQTPTAASRMRSRTPSRTSATSSSSSIASPPLHPPPSSAPSATAAHTTATIKTDVNAIRDRYRKQQRMNFFTRHTPLSTANGSPIASSIKSPETLAINNENKRLSPRNAMTNDLKVMRPSEKPSSHNDSTSSNMKNSSNQPPSAHLSQSNKHRQRAVSMLSSASAISDVLNQDTLLEDDNCSLKSEDLMCDYDDTLTIDSSSKNDQTDSNSLASLSIGSNKQSTTVIAHASTKPNAPLHQQQLPQTKEHRSATIAKCSTATTNDKSNSSLRETLDELTRLSNRMDHNIDNEQNRRLMTRSVSLKPPPSYLPPLEDAEQISMDIESYRQVMKDVMVVKTILHQLDRLLKHSDGANMTDSMIGSFHEHHDHMFSSRRYSTSQNDGSLLNSIDENSTYDDLLKEIMSLRKEKEQDKQTIKLLQEQMYKYSSQTNGG
ncbi:unnamed protein product [Rotaria socialis]|uniref:Uncharacterized protein n=2 Tax=Rotaria socialis TaxID=392032 RepID=A0A820NIJ6_9BILA|nr:unnamed protein product [Rotaria socialis]CAF4391214.1 unnamed protein product [Rotaria socialis]